MYDSQLAIKIIEQHFPHLSDSLHEDSLDDLIHCQMGIFARWAQEVIDAQDTVNWQRISEVFLQLWDNCTENVKNALNVSLLEHLYFADTKRKRSWIRRAWAFDAMHPRMRQAWKEMERYNRELHARRLQKK